MKLKLSCLLWLLTWWILIPPLPIHGQNESTLIFDQFSPAQGFKSSQGLSIVKARDGFVWIGTEQGLVKYDGHHFRTFKADPFNPEALSGNYINRMMEDKHGRLWLRAMSFLNVLDTKTNKVQKVSYSDGSNKGEFPDVFDFKYDEINDVMWLATPRGLMYTQGQNIYLHEEIIPEIKGNINSFLIDRHGIFWLVNTYGLYRYDPTNCGVQVFHRPGKGQRTAGDDGFFSIYSDFNEHLWIGTWNHGLLKFNPKTHDSKLFQFADPTKIQNSVLAISQTADPEEKSILWLGTSDGVKTFDTETDKFTNYSTSDIHDKHGLAGAGFCFAPTKTEGLWIGTYKGLYRYDHFKQNVHKIPIHIDGIQKNWEITDIVFEPCSGKDSIIWFDVPYHSVFRYDIVHHKAATIPEKFRKYCSPAGGPYTLFKTTQNILFTSSETYGLVGYDLKNQNIILPHFPSDSADRPKILHMEEDKNGTVWLGTTRGMYTLNQNYSAVIAVDAMQTYLNKNRLSGHTYRFSLDGNGNPWIIVFDQKNREDALLYYDNASNTGTLFTQNQHKTLKYLSVIEDVQCLDNGQVLLTSYNGFCFLENKPGGVHFQLYQSYEDVPIGVCKNIEADHFGNIWMSSDFGVYQFNQKNHSLHHYSYYNSAIGLLPYPDISFSEETGILYIGQNSAINTIDAGKIKVSAPGNPVISNLSITNYTSEKLPQSGDKLRLNNTQNSLHFEFTNLCFTNSQENTYRYKLEKEGENWIPIPGNILHFNHLGPGHYQLEVQAKNSFGLVNPTNFILYIDIRPPFYKSWWFNLLVLGMISFIIYLVFKYRDIQREKLEKLRHNIARDLHDDMGSSLSYIRMLSEKEAMKNSESSSYQSIASKTAEVMDNMSEIIWSINPLYDTLQNVLLKIQELAIDTLEPLGLDIHFEIEEIPGKFKLSPENRRHYYLIFKEAINNAAKYSRATQIYLSFKSTDALLITEIRDNGIGFDPLLIKKGNGLKNMAKRADLLHGALQIHTDSTGTKIQLILHKKKL